MYRQIVELQALQAALPRTVCLKITTGSSFSTALPLLLSNKMFVFEGNHSHMVRFYRGFFRLRCAIQESAVSRNESSLKKVIPKKPEESSQTLSLTSSLASSK